MMLYNHDGRPLAAENYFMSTLLTPSGFPIQRVEQPIERIPHCLLFFSKIMKEQP